MKLVERVNKIIEDYFMPICGPIKVSCSLDFFYCEDDNEIGWSFLTTERQDRNFNKFFEEELGCQKMHNFIYSLFHEVGHKMTMDSFSSEERLAYRAAKVRLDDMDTCDERDFAYFRLPVEFAASRWAAGYINAHWGEIADWACNTLMPAIDEFMSNSEAVAEITDIIEEEDYYEAL